MGKRVIRRWIWMPGACLIVPLGCLIAGGCAAADAGRQPVRLTAMPRSFVHDVPAPAGFRLDERASEERSTGTTRLYLHHVYRGKASKHDLRDFYAEQMPRHRWSKVSDGSSKGEYSMRFEKGDESCTILVRDRGGWNGGAEVHVIISQEQRGAAPPAAQERT